MFTTINDLLINYELYGEDNSSVIVILHGWKCSLADWRNISTALSKNYKIVLVDLPGFGQSAQPVTTWGTYDYARFVIDFTNSLGIKNFNVIGHSFGGRISILLASKYDIVENLILVDSAGVNSTSKYKKALVKLYKPLKTFSPKMVKGAVSKHIGSSDFKTASTMKDIFIKVVNENFETLLPNINCRTLILWGSRDEILNVNLTKFFTTLYQIVMCELFGAQNITHT